MKILLARIGNYANFIISTIDKNYAFFIFLIAIIVHFSYSQLGWNFPLADPHGFRQTQTAISVFYYLKDGFTVNYITPTLGAPWSRERIDFFNFEEKPVYQNPWGSLYVKKRNYGIL